jgi:hypothetical protein
MTNVNGLTIFKSTADKNHENKKLDFSRGVKVSNSKAATPSTADREVHLPVIKNSQSYKTIEITKGKKINLMNNLNKSNNKSPLSMRPLREEDSLNLPSNQINYENSVSFRTNVKKSPYYFNDPKTSKLMEIKQKFKYKKNYINQGNEVNFISDGGNSLDEYEIL